MKIGDEVYVHGYIDKIRKDTIIIRNNGGYFGTAKEEVTKSPTVDIRDFSDRLWINSRVRAFNEVLEIINKQQIIANHGDAVDAGINSACNYIREEVERLKGEQI